MDQPWVFCPFLPTDNTEAVKPAMDMMVGSLRRLLELPYAAFMQHVLLNAELGAFLGSYLEHRYRLYLKTTNHDAALLEIDRLVVSTVHRLVLSEEGGRGSTSLPSACPLLSVSSMASLASLLGDTNVEIASQLMAGALLARPGFADEVVQTIAEAESTSVQITSSCISSLASRQETVSRNKANEAKVVSLGSKKPTLAEKARAAALAAAAASSASSSSAPRPKISNSLPFDPARLQALIRSTCQWTHYWSCLLPALPQAVVASRSLGLMSTRGNDAVVGKPTVMLLLALRRVYEQVLPALASAKEQYLKLQPVLLLEESNVLREISRLLVYAASRIVKTFRWVLVLAASRSAAAAVGEADNGADGMLWPALFEQLLLSPTDLPRTAPTSSSEGRVDWLVGALISDALRIYPREVADSLVSLCSDKDLSDYFLDAARQPQGLPFLVPPADKSFKGIGGGGGGGGAAARPPYPSPPTTTTTVALTPSSIFEQQSKQIQAVQSLFPDLGEAFIGACLETFDWNSERSIDALLGDNLPPHLRKLDRTLKHAWMGKGGPKGGIAVGSVGKSTEKAYVLPEDEEFKRRQRERLIAEEKARERDFNLLAAEYNDDYDDQWDDARSGEDGVATNSSVEFGTEGAGLKSKRGKSTSSGAQSLAQRIQWEVKLNDVRRLNTLIREKEAEDKFWEDMRNTNHDSSRAEADEDATEAEGGGGPHRGGAPRRGSEQRQQSPQTQTQPHKSHKHKQQQQQQYNAQGSQATQAPVSGSAASKPRTKTFDKHHSKDKALRKMGGYNPG